MNSRYGFSGSGSGNSMATGSNGIVGVGGIGYHTSTSSHQPTYTQTTTIRQMTPGQVLFDIQPSSTVFRSIGLTIGDQNLSRYFLSDPFNYSMRREVFNHGTRYELPSTSSGSSSPTSSSSSPIQPSPLIELGDLVELPTSSDVRAILECPICKEISLPPIYNCSNGHTICNVCRPKITECCLCKSGFSDSRNYGLESLVLRSKFCCSYKDRGCTQVVYGDQFKEHLRNCDSRPGAGNTNTPTKDAQSSAGCRFHNTSESGSDSSFAETDFPVLGWSRQRNGMYPENAIVAGHTPRGQPIIVARAYEGKQLVLGRLIPDEHAAFIYWRGCRRKWYYDVLVGIPETYSWVDASWGDIPSNSITCMEFALGNEQVYIGRALQNGCYYPGYVQSNGQGCIVGVGTQLHVCHDYQVLVRQ